ncbi:MAG: 3-dehydroquinate synthase [Idiomarina sp.]|nr:3-dehydroquinate synthase [Idiomarina sp.]
METLNVQLGARSYPIFVGAALLNQANFILSEQLTGKVFIVSNPTVAEHYLAPLLATLGDRVVGTYLMPDGEVHKSLATYTEAMDAVLASGLHRDGIIVALGGGVVGDLAGFVAATYQRGIALIQIPTTLLSQVDSSVGGKTAVNHPQGKNLIGAFHQPSAVLIDTDTLATLPDRELRAGIAEVIKYGAIIDADFFTWLEHNMSALLARDPAALQYAIQVSCQSKARFVAADEREQGQRALLNFGHTFGHVIEAATGYSEWLHGEGVAAGMVIASYLASVMGWCEASEYRRLRALVEAAGLPATAPDIPWEQWQQRFSRDKKVKAGQVRFILPRRIGQVEMTTSDVSDELLKTAIALK